MKILIDSIKTKAIKELEDEVTDLLQTCSNTILKRIVRSFIAIRDIKNSKKSLAISELFCGLDPKTTLAYYYKNIIDKNSYITVIRSLNNLIDHLEYNILDDGFLSLIKVETNLRTVFYLNTNDEISSEQIAKTIENKSCPEKIKSVSIGHFESMHTFAIFLELLCKNSTYDGYDVKGDAFEHIIEFKNWRGGTKCYQ